MEGLRLAFPSAEDGEGGPFGGLRLHRDLYPILLDEDRKPLRVEELVVELSGQALPIGAYGEAVLVAEGQGIGVVQLVP